uniref:Uncharacterized protein n=1 Tax=Prymnesium polylepis TaxID=72548 RepID=A0A7S4M1T7_9EUKA
MNALFGKKKPTPFAPAAAPPTVADDPTQTINKLRDAMETLEKKEEHLQRKIDQEVKKAREMSAAGKKQDALTCIKRKKMYDKQRLTVSNQLQNLELQKMTIEENNLNKLTFDAARAAAATMKKQTADMGGVDKVEETFEEVEEAMVDASEIGEVLARGINAPGQDFDEDDMLAELEALEQEGLDSQLGAVDLGATSAEDDAEALRRVMPTAPMPSAPTTAVKPAMTDEERELAELEASMAM